MSSGRGSFEKNNENFELQFEESQYVVESLQDPEEELGTSSFKTALEAHPIMTTTNAYAFAPSSLPIHICCYRSRHVQLCGKSNSPGKII